jgi:hypothetical protein
MGARVLRLPTDRQQPRLSVHTGIYLTQTFTPSLQLGEKNGSQKILNAESDAPVRL